MRKAIIVAVVAVVIALSCLLLSTPALADYSENGFLMETRTSGTVNGGVFIGYEAWPGDISEGTTTLTGNFDVPDGEVEWARLYTGIWGGTESNSGWVEVTFNGESGKNGLGQINLQGENDINSNVWCSGCGKHWMYYDVTDLVEQGSMNTATTSKINGSIDGRVYGIVLVVVYEGGDDPKDIQYWINDGSDALNTNHDEGTTDFEGYIDVSSIADAKLTMVHLTAYEPPCSDCLQFNEHSLDTSMVDSNTFALNSWDVTDYVESEENNVWFSQGDDLYISVTNAILIVERRAEEESEDKPDLDATAIKPYHYEWMEEENLPKGEPWFNLTNYVNVTVKNSGTEDAGSVDVKLYADDELIGSETVEKLSSGGSKDIKFEWRPVGEDPLSWIDTAEGAKLSYKDTSRIYTLRVVVDESDEILEESEANNELTKEQKVVWNGYMADEPLERYVHGKVNGGIIYDTGDGQYRVIGSGAENSAYKDLNYDLVIPGKTKLARLYIYYTWAKPSYKAPKIDVNIETPSGKIHNLGMEKSYNDIKGDFGAFKYAWGTYAYNISDYVNESGTYVVSINNRNKGDDPDFATEFALAAPAILVVYEDKTAPKREYWINEGANVLIGGRRSDGGFLSLEECRNPALFTGNIDLKKVEKAVIGVVAPWGDSSEGNVFYFNANELEEGGYCGYSSPCSDEIGGISMNIGSSNAQVGVAAIDVTKYLKKDKNTVIQGDDGDNMMPSNAFLVVTYSSIPIITQTPAPTTTPTTTVNVTSTPTPVTTLTLPSEETSETDEAPVPGFELAFSLFMLIVVAYLLRKENR